MNSILEPLSNLNTLIFITANQNKKSYKNYAEQLIKLFNQYKANATNQWYRSIEIDVDNINTQHEHDSRSGKESICERVKSLMKKEKQKQQLIQKKSSRPSSSPLSQQSLSSQPCSQQKIRQLFCIGFYNLSKISTRPRYLQVALQLVLPPPEYKPSLQLLKIKWWLQMLALISSREIHCEAYYEACKLIAHIIHKIQGLELGKEDAMLAREVVELVYRSKGMNMISANSLNQLQMNRKFDTDCYYVTKSFHIADIMIMQPISPTQPLNLLLLYPPFSSQSKLPTIPTAPVSQLHHYIIFLAIACFTRATEKFYCHDSSDKEYHYKAIQICNYLYSSKSTFIRFLARTYKEHYLQKLQNIEEVCEYGDRKVKVLEDGEEVSMLGQMPWESQQQQVEEHQEQMEEMQQSNRETCEDVYVDRQEIYRS